MLGIKVGHGIHRTSNQLLSANSRVKTTLTRTNRGWYRRTIIKVRQQHITSTRIRQLHHIGIIQGSETCIYVITTNRISSKELRPIHIITSNSYTTRKVIKISWNGSANDRGLHLKLMYLKRLVKTFKIKHLQRQNRLQWNSYRIARKIICLSATKTIQLNT